MKKLVYFILCFISIFIGCAIHKSVTFSDTNVLTVILTLIAMVFFFTGVVYLAYLVGILLVKVDSKQSEAYSILVDDKKALDKRFDAKTLKRLRLNKGLSIALMIVFIILFGSIYFTWLDTWKNKEIDANKIEITVPIDGISWAKGRYANFTFRYNNQTYKDRTGDNELQIGNYITIDFSARNPKIWRRKFNH